MSPRNCLFKIIFPLKLPYWLKALSPRRMAWSFVCPIPEQMSWVLPSVTRKWPFQDHLLTKTIILTQSSVSWQNDLKLCFPSTWINEPGLPSVTEKWPFQDHLATKTIVLTWSCISCENSLTFCLVEEWSKVLSPWDLNRWGVFPSITTKWPFQDYLAGSSCLPGDWLEALSPQDPNKWTESYPLSLRNCLFKTILPLKLSYQLKALSPVRTTQRSDS